MKKSLRRVYYGTGVCVWGFAAEGHGAGRRHALSFSSFGGHGPVPHGAAGGGKPRQDGSTISKGLSLVEHDVARGMDARWALVAYGGNDSDFDWAGIAADPEGDHRPRTELPEFLSKLKQTVTELARVGVQPVLMTLPPIDGARYLDYICRGGLSRDSIMRWLGDVGCIYRHQELYSDTVASFAMREGLPLIDVRRRFLPQRDLSELISADGIHLTMPGYRQLFDTLAQWVVPQLA